MSLETQLTALKNARATGEKRVTYNGKTVEYRDIAELNLAIAAVEAEIDGESASPKSHSSVSYHSRGYNSW